MFITPEKASVHRVKSMRINRSRSSLGSSPSRRFTSSLHVSREKLQKQRIEQARLFSESLRRRIGHLDVTKVKPKRTKSVMRFGKARQANMYLHHMNPEVPSDKILKKKKRRKYFYQGSRLTPHCQDLLQRFSTKPKMDVDPKKFELTNLSFLPSNKYTPGKKLPKCLYMEIGTRMFEKDVGVHVHNGLVVVFKDLEHLTIEGRTDFWLKLKIFRVQGFRKRDSELAMFPMRDRHQSFKFKDLKFIVLAHHGDSWVRMNVAVREKTFKRMQVELHENDRLKALFSGLCGATIKKILKFHSFNLKWWQMNDSEWSTTSKSLSRLLFGYFPQAREDVFLVFPAVVYHCFDEKILPRQIVSFVNSSMFSTLTRFSDSEYEQYRDLEAIFNLNVRRFDIDTIRKFPKLRILHIHFFLDVFSNESESDDAMEEKAYLALLPTLNEMVNLERLSIRCYMNRDFVRGYGDEEEEERSGETKMRMTKKRRIKEFPQQILKFGEAGIPLIGRGQDINLPNLRFLNLEGLPIDSGLLGGGEAMRKKLTHLRDLRFKKCFVSGSQLRALSFLPNLTRLALRKCVLQRKDFKMYIEGDLIGRMEHFRINELILLQKISDIQYDITMDPSVQYVNWNHEEWSDDEDYLM